MSDGEEKATVKRSKVLLAAALAVVLVVGVLFGGVGVGHGLFNNGRGPTGSEPARCEKDSCKGGEQRAAGH